MDGAGAIFDISMESKTCHVSLSWNLKEPIQKISYSGWVSWGTYEGKKWG